MQKKMGRQRNRRWNGQASKSIQVDVEQTIGNNTKRQQTGDSGMPPNRMVQTPSA